MRRSINDDYNTKGSRRDSKKKFRKDKGGRGVDKNKKGRMLAEAVYLEDMGRAAEGKDAVDYHKRVTDGHQYSIEEEVNEAVQRNLASGVNVLEMDIEMEKLEEIAQHFRNDGSLIDLDPRLGKIHVYSNNIRQDVGVDEEIVVVMSGNDVLDSKIEERLKKMYQRPGQLTRIWPKDK